MRVKKIDIFGFKSFASRQTLFFGKGITGVVGPNGCGKSNVVDALRWVMGEQNARHLRGGNMQDIIFCGSEKKAPLGFAEVILTIENDKQDAPLEYNHFTEIQITRRLYKTGESEYEINKQKARLKDISDFFLGTGVGSKAYSIIEQGRVNDLISSKPSDRRLLIEEAAGITKYKSKKALAERRMEATRINLERIVDIKKEVDKRVASLAREKEKLIKVHALANSVREIDLHLACHKYLENFSTLNFLLKKKSNLDNHILNNKKELAIADDKFDSLLKNFSETNERKRLLEELSAQHKTSLELLKKDQEYAKTTLDDGMLQATRVSAQLDDIEKRKKELDDDVFRHAKDHEKIKLAYQEITKELSDKRAQGTQVIDLRQKNISAERDLQRKLTEAATDAVRLQSQITSHQEQNEQREADLRRAQAEHKKKTEDLDMVKSQEAALDHDLEQKRRDLADIACKIKTADESVAQARKNEQQCANDMDRLRKDRVTLSSRLDSLKEIDSQCEWTQSGLSDLMASDERKLIAGIIADIIKVKPGHEEVVENCIAHLLDCAVLFDPHDLKALTQVLKEKKSANTTFFIPAKASEESSIVKPLGLKQLSEIVEIKDDRYLAIKHHLSRYFLTSDLTTAIDHWPKARLNQINLVTSDGAMLLPDGRALVSGQKNDKGILKRKNDIKDLGQELISIEASHIEAEQRLDDARRAKKAAIDAKQKLVHELEALKTVLARLDAAVKQKRFEISRLDKEMIDLAERSARLQNSRTDAEAKVVVLKEQWAQALEQHKKFDEDIQKIIEERSRVEADYESFQRQLKDLEIDKASLREKSDNLANALSSHQKNIEHLLSQRRSLEEQASQYSQQEVRLKESLRQAQKKSLALDKELVEAKRMLEAVSAECTVLFEQKSSQENVLAKMRERAQEFMTNLHQQELLINNVEHQLKNLCNRILEKYRLKLTDQLSDFHDRPIDEAEGVKRRNELEKQRSRMGAVNENAADEFDEYDARAQFLAAQIDDLSDGLSQLQTAIKKINQTTKMRFLEAFNNINRQFSNVFPRLFNGGRAELVLCDQEDLLNCGVDIIAKPPGKNIGSIDLMSGGEKALTAISLIMAIFLIKPSPFCLLDEVDAPLDEANVSRFSSLIKEMSALSQFIVITHNRKTMEAADQLYGVTMEDAGMSKVVSVHVQQAYDALKQPNQGLSRASKPTQLFLDDVIA